MTYRILDEYLGAPVPPVDWVAAFRKRAEDAAREGARRRVGEGGRRARRRVAARAAAREVRGPLPRPVVRRRRRSAEEGGRLVLTMTRTPGMVADLEHWQHDTFVARWREAFMSDAAPADAYVSFALKPDAVDRARDDGARLAGHRLQLRLPGPPAHAGPGGRHPAKAP